MQLLIEKEENTVKRQDVATLAAQEAITFRTLALALVSWCFLRYAPCTHNVH